MKHAINGLMALLLVLSLPSAAHTLQAHLIITEMAMSQLTKSEQKYFNLLAKRLLIQLPAEQQKPTIKKYQGASDFALISRFPDDVKKVRVGNLFKKYGTSLPKELAYYEMKNSAKWHYVNMPVKRKCHYQKDGYVVDMIPRLLSAYQYANAVKDKAILLAFISHLVADAHQPLHAYNRYDARCKHDMGGNKYCVQKTASGRCLKSLHGFWDDSVGYLKDSKDIPYYVNAIMRKTIAAEGSETLSTWLYENKPFAKFAYSIRQGETIPKSYYQKGQTIMQQRMRDAADRLALILKELYRESH